MDELAAEAGVSKRTLYRYFRSKEEMIEAVLEKLMANIESLIKEFVASHHKPDEIVAYMLRSCTGLYRLFFIPWCSVICKSIIPITEKRSISFA